MSLKKVFALLLTLAMVLSLAACGSKEETPVEPSGDAVSDTPTEEGSGKIRVGFVSATFADEWCHNLAMAMENLASTEYPELKQRFWTAMLTQPSRWTLCRRCCSRALITWRSSLCPAQNPHWWRP